jgi:futalosine hydrolase
LVACASPREREAASFEAQTLGVGKAAAAASLARALSNARVDCVLLFGVCGSYDNDGANALQVGELCLVGSEVLGDEGVEAPTGFSSLADLQLGDVGPFEAAADLTKAAAEILSIPVVGGATVSSCSATDERARALAARTGAAVESMEGAAVAIACAAAGVPWVQLRCVSNRTGDRARAGWALEPAIAKVQGAVAVLLEAWS